MSLCGRTEISIFKSWCFLSSYSKWHARAEGPCVRLDPELNRKELCSGDLGQVLKRTHHPLQITWECCFLNIYLQAEKGRTDIQYKRGRQDLLVQAAEREENYEESVTETLRHSITNSFSILGICDLKAGSLDANLFNGWFPEVQRFMIYIRQCVNVSFTISRYSFQVSTLATFGTPGWGWWDIWQWHEPR